MLVSIQIIIIITNTYIGTNYNGSQRQNPPAKEGIDNYLEKAILLTGGMHKNNFGDASKIGWSRGSRTDKGVHALKNVVSLKLMVKPDELENDPLGFSILLIKLLLNSTFCEANA